LDVHTKGLHHSQLHFENSNNKAVEAQKKIKRGYGIAE
jgi:hypothetical protein